MNLYSPVMSASSSGFFSSSVPEEGTSSTLTVASVLSMIISGVIFLGEEDFESEPIESA
jgi:hypothetical protein